MRSWKDQELIVNLRGQITLTLQVVRDRQSRLLQLRRSAVMKWIDLHLTMLTLFPVDCCVPLSPQGDSGFAVYRQRSLLVKSRPLQHYFDCPLQFGAFPEYVEATDTAEMADLYSIALQPGDVIVSGMSTGCTSQAMSLAGECQHEGVLQELAALPHATSPTSGNHKVWWARTP